MDSNIQNTNTVETVAPNNSGLNFVKLPAKNDLINANENRDMNGIYKSGACKSFLPLKYSLSLVF